ncbi:MAG: hypothetical protein CVT94_05005 [Bacteroidetes bacterium HGW-Bacteroidetes-11]|jgi:hypothetical protein|nr:MAG: hypothetical protein CVT94_05005 [Bacteroidetes bacterium HGW-Bacteroidetes-11]
MKKLYLLILHTIVITGITHAQPFVNISSSLQGIGRGSVIFADFNNDNNLDLFIAGQDGNYNPFARIYLNENGSFVATESGISGLENCAAAAADYDLDGLIDIVITGADFDGNKTVLYKNAGNGQFLAMPVSFYAAGAGGDLAWGDYNNDGFPDLVISGNWNTMLYTNNGDGTFSAANAGLIGMNSPSLAWGDCDNDGDLDLLMVGDAGSVGETYIYLNDNGIFNRLEVPVEGAVGGDAQWGDFDNDGNIDILITGKDASLTPVSYVYRNNGDNTFSFANAGLVGTALGPANWIDFDNDGDLDIMLSGQNAGCGNASTRLYANNGVGDFSEFPAGLAYVERAASAWGDYDNDGDYDLVLTGISGSHTTKLYRNDLNTSDFQQNTPPTIPQNLYTYVSGGYAVISWQRSTDAQSPSEAITYNVMMGTTSGSIDKISPMANPANGQRYAAAPGNSGQNDFMVFRNLAPGDYYFRVQAIDQAYAGSDFSEEGSFTILPTSAATLPADDLKIFVMDHTLIIHGLKNTPSVVSIISLTGKTVFLGQSTGTSLEIPMAGYASGIYIVKVITDGRVVAKKMIK